MKIDTLTKQLRLLFLLSQNGFCNDCVCNGNVDPALGPTCDMMSGQCLNCQNNTFGFGCQLCLDGYYGDVANGIPCKGKEN